MHLLPKDGKDKLGNLFWSGVKRLPDPVTFDRSDPLHVKFITATANLIALNFNIKQERDTNIIASMADKTQVEEFKLRNIKVDLPDGEVKFSEESKGQAATEDIDVIKSIKEYLNHGGVTSKGISPIEFEKDDDTNFHIDFIHAVANIRARNYKLPEVD